MDYNYIIRGLSRNKIIFEEMLKDISENEYTWKPSKDKWSLIEILCHLYDEEREDFRARTHHVLETPENEAPLTNPEEWVQSRKYAEQSYSEMLNKFLYEREVSVEWLQNLKNPNWENAYNHPVHGELKAKMFLINWLAHDFRHINQIINLRYEFLKHISRDNLRYAG